VPFFILSKVDSDLTLYPHPFSLPISVAPSVFQSESFHQVDGTSAREDISCLDGIFVGIQLFSVCKN